MTRADVLQRLQRVVPELTGRFHVRSLSLFGSVARGEEGLESDVDLLVGFSKPPGFDGYMSLKFFIEDLLEAKVDLVMETALRPDARPFVDAEAVRVA